MNNLPPGCTNADIDRAAGSVTCCECGWVFIADVEDCDNWTCRRCAVAIARQDMDNDE